MLLTLAAGLLLLGERTAWVRMPDARLAKCHAALVTASHSQRADVTCIDPDGQELLRLSISPATDAALLAVSAGSGSIVIVYAKDGDTYQTTLVRRTGGTFAALLPTPIATRAPGNLCIAGNLRGSFRLVEAAPDSDTAESSPGPQRFKVNVWRSQGGSLAGPDSHTTQGPVANWKAAVESLGYRDCRALYTLGASEPHL